jgi:RNA polymerase sigma-70 factor (ECF subfamily)
LQKAYLKMHRGRHQFRSGEVFEAWFFSILRNTWVDELRRDGRKPDEHHALPIDEVSESLLPSVEQVPFQESLNTAGAAVGDAVEALPGHHREALELRYQDGVSFTGLARHWKVSEVAARKRVSRAVQALKELLGAPRSSEKQEEKSL